MRQFLTLMGGIVALAVAAPAAATVKVDSQAYGFDAPAGAQAVIGFDTPLQPGFTLAGGMLKTGTSDTGAAPAIGEGLKDTTAYLAANPGDAATLTSVTGYRTVSFLWGSIDSYNKLSLLDAGGNTIESFIGRQITDAPNGNRQKSLTNRRVTFTVDGDSPAIYGLRFSSTDPAFEIDNVAFSGAVPEPATWAMMIGGIGFAGGALRRRPRGHGEAAIA